MNLITITKRLLAHVSRRFALCGRMPFLPPKPCTHQGCGALVRDGSGRCAAHPKRAWAGSGNETKRLRGRAGVERRTRWLTLHPYCKHCEAKGINRLGFTPDHIVPLSEGGRDDESNIQTLCEPCHRVKTQAEAARGRQRRTG